LSNIDAEIGQNINRGARIGQIDLLDELKITIQVDQYYISRVQAGTLGKVDVDGTSYPVAVEKIYSEVVDGAFRVDVAFADRQPQGLHRGQRLTVELSFGEPTQQVIVAKGGFMQSTGGRWAYLISPDGRSARRTPIRLGRQNPRFVEVLDGLRPGDRIVASSYDVFNDVDELRFTQPIQAIDGRRAAADARRDARAGTP
jgi:HlyD family secretion protein